MGAKTSPRRVSGAACGEWTSQDGQKHWKSCFFSCFCNHPPVVGMPSQPRERNSGLTEGYTWVRNLNLMGDYLIDHFFFW